MSHMVTMWLLRCTFISLLVTVSLGRLKWGGGGGGLGGGVCVWGGGGGESESAMTGGRRVNFFYSVRSRQEWWAFVIWGAQMAILVIWGQHGGAQRSSLSAMVIF